MPKIHKDNIPMRPVVSYVTAPAYKLAKFLNEKLPKYLDFHPKYTVKNSLELVDKIKEYRLSNNYKFASFDVKSLFTSIPVNF